MDDTPPAVYAAADGGGGGGVGAGAGGLVVENDGMEEEMAEKKEATMPFSEPLSLSTDPPLELRAEVLFVFEGSVLLFVPPLVPASNDDSEEFIDKLLNRGGRGSRLWLDRNPDTVSTRSVAGNRLEREWGWVFEGGGGSKRRERGLVVLSKSTCRGLLLRALALSEVGRGSESTTTFHNAMERWAEEDDDDDDDDVEVEPSTLLACSLLLVASTPPSSSSLIDSSSAMEKIPVDRERIKKREVT